MKSPRLLLFIAILASLALAWPGFAQTSTQSEQGRVDTIKTLDTLAGALAKQRQAIRKLEAGLANATGSARKAELEKTIAMQRAELAKRQLDFDSIATGLDVGQLVETEGPAFDLGREIEGLVRPMVQRLKDATKEPRQIEQLRHEVDVRHERAQSASRAADHVRRLLSRSPPATLEAELEAVRTRWLATRDDALNREKIARLQLDAKLRQRRSLVTSTSEFLSGFFKERGINLLLAVAVFFGVLLSLRLFARPIRYAWTRRDKEPRVPRFYARMVNFTFYTISTLAAITGALLVFYAAGDWLLLGLTLMFLLGLLWSVKNTIPKYLDQIRLMLNLGAVREGERLVFEGIPWRVDTLNIYTKLTNPDLQGGVLRLPIRHLVGMHSRPIADREPWFPSRDGDWVLVGDVRGRVVSQTPETVQLVQLGGARVTYQTADYLAANPTNLSHNFRASIVFGIDYDHQAIATTRVPDVMQRRVEADMIDIVGEENVMNINVEFLAAGASSLDYAILADFRGDVAKDYDRVQRAIQSSLVDACNENGWVIPFTQITLHQAQAC